MEYFDDDTLIANAYKNSKRIKKDKTIKQLAKYYWKSMNSRVGKGYYSNIKIEWEYTSFEEWFIGQEEKIIQIKNAGKTPSIDRINPTLHYTEQNCRIIPNDLNTALGQITGLTTQLKKLYLFVENNKHWL